MRRALALALACWALLALLACAADDAAAPGAAAAPTHYMLMSIGLRGHAVPLLRLASALRLRGHRVTFVTNDNAAEWVSKAGVDFLSAGPFPIPPADLQVTMRRIAKDPSTFRGILAVFNEVYLAAAQPMYRAVIEQVEADPPDLIVLDMGTLAAQDVAHKLRIPYITNSATLLWDLEGSPAFVPAWGTGFSADMTLWNRCMNLLFPRLLSVALTPPFMAVNKLRFDQALEPFRSQHDIFRSTRILLDTSFGLDYSRPLSPLQTMVGALLPPEGSPLAAEELPPKLAAWLDESLAAGAPVALVSLGSMTHIEWWQAEALLAGAARAGVRALWLLPAEQQAVLVPDAPPSEVRIKVPGSVPPLRVLAHPATRLSVTHCGMGSVQESLVHGKPTLCIPFFADQPDVAARVLDAGAGLVLDKLAFDEDEVAAKVAALATNATFAASARRVGDSLRAAGGVERAADLVESTLRLGSEHLYTVDLLLPWHQSAQLDVIAVYTAVVALSAVVVRVMWLGAVGAVGYVWSRRRASAGSSGGGAAASASADGGGGDSGEAGAGAGAE